MAAERATARITIEVDDGSTIGGYLAEPAGPGPHPGVVVAHQLFGVTPDIVAVADRLAGLGYRALAPDFYHRSEPGLALPADDAGRTRGLALLAELTRAGVLADLSAARDYLRDRPGSSGRVGVLGVSMGGHLAYLAATRLDLPLALVLYAGWLTGTDIPLSRPEPTLDSTGAITGRLVYVVGDEDHVVDAEQRSTIAAKLAAEDVDHDFVVLPGAPHAFLSEGTPSYREQAAGQTWDLIERELRAALG